MAFQKPMGAGNGEAFLRMGRIVDKGSYSY